MFQEILYVSPCSLHNKLANVMALWARRLWVMLASLMVRVRVGHIYTVLAWRQATPFRKTNSETQGEGFGVIWYQCSWRLKLTTQAINSLIMPM